MDISALVVKNNKVLLLRSSYQYYWTLPGGYLKVDEDLNESIQREIKEELGLKVVVDKLLKVRVVPKKPVVDILVLCKIVSGEIKVDGKEIKEAGFFDINNMPTKDNMPPYQLEYIDLLKEVKV